MPAKYTSAQVSYRKKKDGVTIASGAVYSAYPYLAQGQMTIIILDSLLQLLQIEGNDLVVKGDQFLLFDLILRLIRDDCNFYTLKIPELIKDTEHETEAHIVRYLDGNH